MPLMSMRAYAKHRGVSPEAVSKAARVGRISTVVDANGVRKIDSEVADREWGENTDEGRGANEALSGPRSKKDAPETEKKDNPISKSYAQSRAAREAYAARLAKLDFEHKSGKLVDAEAVRNEAFKSARVVRDALMNIPDRIAAELAAETNIFKIHSRLSEELRKSLESLSFE